MEQFRFKAFISYRHDASREVATALEKALRQYAKPLFKPPIPVFRDEKQIGAGQDLRKTIQEALRDSAYLIYIASREAAESPYVRQELELWCGELQRQDRLIIVWEKDRLRADPERDSLDWEASDAIPSSLKDCLSGIPLWLDLTWADDDRDLDIVNPRFKTLVNAIVARFRAIPPEQLIGVEIATYRRNILVRRLGIGALATALMLAIVGGGIAFQQRNSAVAERDRARSNLLVNASTGVRPWNTTLALGFAAEAYRLSLPEVAPETAEALLRAFYEQDGDTTVPYRHLLAHESGVSTGDYSPDGNLLVTGTNNGFVALWSPDGLLQTNFQAHRFKVLSAAFSPDGSRIASTALMETSVPLRDLDGNKLDALEHRGSEFSFVTFAPDDGAMLVSFGGEHYRRAFKLWDPNGEAVKLVDPDLQFVEAARYTLRDVAFTVNDKSIAGLLEKRGKISLAYWDREGRRLDRFSSNRVGREGAANRRGNFTLPKVRFSRPVFGGDLVYSDASSGYWEGIPKADQTKLVDFVSSPDGRFFLGTAGDASVRIWDNKGRLSSSFPLPGGMRGTAFAGADGHVVTLSEQHAIKIWDQSGKRIKTLRGHAAPITAVRSSPDAGTLFSASEDATAKLWPLSGDFAPACTAERSGVSSVKFSPDNGGLLLILSTDGRAYLWRPEEGDGISELVHRQAIRDAWFSSDGRHVLSVAEGGSDLVIWSLDGKTQQRCCEHRAPLANVTVANDGEHFLTTYDDGTVKLWTNKGRPVATIGEQAGQRLTAVFSPDGEHILTYGLSSGAKLWNLQGKAIDSDHVGQLGINDARYSPRGGRLILRSSNGMSLWDGDGKHIPSEIEQGGDMTYSFRWLGQGEAIVTTHSGGRVKVWDAGGALRHTWRIPMESMSFGAYGSPDGNYLVGSHVDIRTLDGALLGSLASSRFLEFITDDLVLVYALRKDHSEVTIRNRKGDLVTALARLPGSFISADVSPDGRLIALVSEAGELALRCAASGVHYAIEREDFHRPDLAERMRYGIDWNRPQQ